MKGLAAFLAVAVLAILARPGAAAEVRDQSRESQLSAVPVPQTSIVSPQGFPVRPVPQDAAPAAAETGAAALLDLGTPAAADGRFRLISARLREKYRSFRESLTSP